MITFSELTTNAGSVERYMNDGKTPLRRLSPQELKTKLERLPDLADVYFFHSLVVELHPETEIERLHQSNCQRSGNLLVLMLRHFEKLYQQLNGPSSRMPDTQYWLDMLRLAIYSLEAWYDSIGDPTYSKGNPRPRKHRQMYVRWIIYTLVVITDVSGCDCALPFMEKTEELVRMAQEIGFDNNKTHNRIKADATVERGFRPLDQYPLSQRGTGEMPTIISNPTPYGNSHIAFTRDGAVEDHSKLNVGRINSKYVKSEMTKQ